MNACYLFLGSLCTLTYTHAHAYFILFNCVFTCLFIPYYLYLLAAYDYAKKTRMWLYLKDVFQGSIPTLKSNSASVFACCEVHPLCA